MKKNYTHISRLLTASVMLFLVSALTLLGQTPTTFQYQAVLRNADGTINADANVNIMLELHQTTEAGTVVYDETHSVTTSEFGMVNLEMGSETPATFAAIDWAAGPYFVEVSVNGLSMGTSELLTVPYALYAVNGVPGPQGDQGIQGIQGIQGEPGLPGVIEANSVGSSHVIDNSLTAIDLASNSVGSSELGANAVASGSIVNGSILNADINAAAAIASSKIFGDAGIEYNPTNVNSTWTVGQYETRNLGSIEMTIPENGYVIVIHSGFGQLYNQSRVMYPGISTTTTDMDELTVLGFVFGSSPDDLMMSYTVTHVYEVTPGTSIFYALARGHSTYATGTAQISKRSLIGIFIPKEY